MADFNIQGQEVIRKKAKKHGTGAVVYVPKSWSGQRITVVREMEYELNDIAKTLSREGNMVYSYYCLDMVHRGHLLQMENAKAVAGKDGISIGGIFKDEAVIEIAKRAINKKTGARGLRSIIESLLLKTMFKLPGVDDVEEVLINESVVKKGTEPLLIHSKTKKTVAA